MCQHYSLLIQLIKVYGKTAREKNSIYKDFSDHRFWGESPTGAETNTMASLHKSFIIFKKYFIHLFERGNSERDLPATVSLSKWPLEPG